MSVSLKRID